jgi:hypothetical protein
MLLTNGSDSSSDAESWKHSLCHNTTQYCVSTDILKVYPKYIKDYIYIYHKEVETISGRTKAQSITKLHGVGTSAFLAYLHALLDVKCGRKFVRPMADAVLARDEYHAGGCDPVKSKIEKSVEALKLQAGSWCVACLGAQRNALFIPPKCWTKHTCFNGEKYLEYSRRNGTELKSGHAQVPTQRRMAHGCRG